MSTDLRLVISGRPYPGRRGRPVQRLIRRVDRAITTLLRWQELARQRRALLGLDDHMLKDIGLSRADALREAERPFWDEGSLSWRR
jgi:uncharacterized protein YjiS (DUF1127 family)